MGVAPSEKNEREPFEPLSNLKGSLSDLRETIRSNQQLRAEFIEFANAVLARNRERLTRRPFPSLPPFCHCIAIEKRK